MNLRVRWLYLLILLFAPTLGAAGESNPLEAVLGAASVTQGEDLVYLFPRTDLNLLVGGVPLEPEMGLENRFEFKPTGKNGRLIGQLLLVDSEIPKILEYLDRHHGKVEGLSHGLLDESPAVKFLRFEARGTFTKLGEDTKGLLTTLGCLKGGATPTPAVDETPDPVFQKQANSLLGAGQWKGRVYCQRLETGSNTPNTGVPMENPSVSADFYLQKTYEGALVMGDLIVPPEQAEAFYQIMSTNRLELTSWILEKDGEGPALTHLRFMGRTSLEELARGLNLLQIQWNTQFPSK